MYESDLSRWADDGGRHETVDRSAVEERVDLATTPTDRRSAPPAAIATAGTPPPLPNTAAVEALMVVIRADEDPDPAAIAAAADEAGMTREELISRLYSSYISELRIERDFRIALMRVDDPKGALAEELRDLGILLVRLGDRIPSIDPLPRETVTQLSMVVNAARAGVVAVNATLRSLQAA
jgi:hypothetical protein